jgi:hypothetical protein
MLLPYNKNKLWFTIVGTGRCGTVYFAKLLTAIGLPCGHERMFGPEGLEHALKFNTNNSDVSQHSGLVNKGNYFVAESSYMAVPYLEHSILNDTTVIHAIRNPIKVILSFHNKLQYWHSAHLNRWETFIQNFVDVGNGSPLDKCCKYVVDWNKNIELCQKKRYLRIKLEDGTEPLLNFLKYKKPINLPPSNTFEEWEHRKPPLAQPANAEDVMNSRYGNDVKKLMLDYGYEHEV